MSRSKYGYRTYTDPRTGGTYLGLTIDPGPREYGVLPASAWPLETTMYDRMTHVDGDCDELYVHHATRADGTPCLQVNAGRDGDWYAVQLDREAAWKLREVVTSFLQATTPPADPPSPQEPPGG